ncbi:MAG TPA: hypothetical protein VFT87_03835 [Candidatus Saccharimonadales bacterium]|nr:hypothetical protein [Candidatus Saccharimonadales bacterium]
MATAKSMDNKGGLRVPLDQADYDDAERLTYNGQLLTGVAIETDPDGGVVGETSYSHGVLDGPDRSYRENGTLRAEEIYKFGIIQQAQQWHENGQLAYKMHADQFGKMISEQRWDENGDPVE